MEALQRMMTRRLDEHSYKRTAKRLVVVDEYASDVDFNDKTEIASMNPAYDIIYGETVRTRSIPNGSTTSASFSATTCPATTSPSSIYYVEPTSTVTAPAVNDDYNRTDKLLRKVSLAIRRKVTSPKLFINEQCDPCRMSNRDKESNHNDLKTSERIVQNDLEKQIRLKSAKKMIDLVDLCSIGRKHRSEHRKLLNEEYGDDY
ncbi:Uncharacterized protein BM_BM10946 [Brugia malayi]|uniref:Bm10946 n=2 Tax=Brugia TaxID=6278 RepID=A0A0H5SR15_BRUMA|nr:Uncharacterized protein BM_BM10946 [Brugia malayi]CRZ25983.1 Bm10946 [Brugia malayi]VIO86378.1 Uncharacterized protein BM_BM10946 [Brugia malayi]